MAQVLQSPDAWDRGLEPAPAHAGPIQHRPDQRQAAVLGGQAPDHLDPAPALAEGPLQQVGVADALAVLDWQVEVSGERAQVGEQAINRPGVLGAVLGREGVRPLLGDGDRLLPRRGGR